MIYGSPAILVVDDQTDRIGIRTLVLSQLWQPQQPVLTQADLDAQQPAIPDVPGGVLLIGQQTRRVGGALRTSWTFEGINGDGKSVTFKDRSHSIDYWFEASFSERSMLRKPNIQALMNQYGGYPVDGQIIWPATVPASAGSANGAVKSTTTAGDPNPLFGQDTYFGLGGTYHFRYAVPTGTAVPDIGGKLFESASLPGRAPTFFGTDANGNQVQRNWLGVAPSPRRVGLVDEIVEQYWLSEDDRWPSAIYGKGTASIPASGLTTGRLTTGSL